MAMIFQPCRSYHINYAHQRNFPQSRVVRMWSCTCVQILEADLVVWAAGSTPVPRVESGKLSLPFPSNSRGATQTDATLRVSLENFGAYNRHTKNCIEVPHGQLVRASVTIGQVSAVMP